MQKSRKITVSVSHYHSLNADIMTSKKLRVSNPCYFEDSSVPTDVWCKDVFRLSSVIFHNQRSNKKWSNWPPPQPSKPLHRIVCLFLPPGEYHQLQYHRLKNHQINQHIFHHNVPFEKLYQFFISTTLLVSIQKLFYQFLTARSSRCSFE